MTPFPVTLETLNLNLLEKLSFVSFEWWILRFDKIQLFTARCLSERVGEVEVVCSDVLQVTKSDVQTNMIIIVAVILSITGTESQNMKTPLT